jgi:predicted 3-demethylubiquinone-9 3-methyltransferase (glyoxalase superfamily)
METTQTDIAAVPGKQSPASKEQKITPFLWFNGNVEEALNFYTGIFKNSKVSNVKKIGAEHTDGRGKVFTATFNLEGQEFMALDGGPHFSFSPAISFFVKCKDQQEVDYYWDKLSAGGEIQQCGWLKDKFGVSWQIIPDALGRLLNDPDPVKAGRVMSAMLKMKKIIVKDLEEA